MKLIGGLLGMKKTAIILFPQFCNYEISVLLEILALNEKPVSFLGSSLAPVRCEEGMNVIPDILYENCIIDEYDSLVITGSYADGLHYNFADEKLHELIKQFESKNKLLAAISSGPMVLCKAGVTKGKSFIAGTEKEWFLNDTKMLLTQEKMAGLIDVHDMKKMIECKKELPKFVLDKNLLTAPGWYFREWAIAFATELGLEGFGESFGL